MANEFDDLLRKRIDDAEFEYEPRNWERMTSMLNSKASRGGRFWLFFNACAMAASVAFAFGVVQHPEHTDIRIEPGQYSSVSSEAPAQLAEKQTLPASQTAATRPLILKTHPIAIRTTEAVNKKEDEQTTELNPEQTEPNRENTTAAVTTKPEKVIGAPTYPEPSFDYPVPKTDRKTAFSLAGGISQGSLNTGYTLGVNARTKIGRKIYLEGDLAYNNNAKAGELNKINTAYGTVTNGLMDKYETSNLASLSYLQFSPSVGYQFTQKISLSAGADLQKLVSGKDGDVYVGSEGNEKQLPDLDYGVTGKAEVAITKRLRAGLLYREGVNNVVRSSNNYFERRYLQVQLKFRVMER